MWLGTVLFALALCATLVISQESPRSSRKETRSARPPWRAQYPVNSASLRQRHDDDLEMARRLLALRQELRQDKEHDADRRRSLHSAMQRLNQEVTKQGLVNNSDDTREEITPEILHFWTELDHIPRECKLTLLARLYAASMTDMLYEDQERSDQDLLYYLWDISWEANVTALGLDFTELEAALHEATHVLFPIVKELFGRVEQSLSTEYGDLLSKEVRNVFEKFTTTLDLAELPNRMNTLSKDILERLKPVYESGICSTDDPRRLEETHDKIEEILNHYEEVIAMPGSPGSHIQTNSDPRKTEVVVRLGKLLLAKSRSRLNDAALIFQEITANETADLTKSILEYVGARLWIETAIRSSFREAILDVDPETRLAKFIFKNPAKFDQLMMKGIGVFLGKFKEISPTCQKMFYSRLIAGAIKWHVTQVVNMTEEDWVWTALTQAREVGLHSDSELESPELYNQLLTLVRHVKLLMDEVASSVASEVMAAGLHIDEGNNMEIVDTLKHLNPEMVSVEALGNVLEMIITGVTDALRDVETDKCTDPTGILNQALAAASNVYDRMEPMDFNEMFTDLFRNMTDMPQSVKTLAIAAAQMLKDMEFVPQGRDFIHRVELSLQYPTAMREHAMNIIGGWVWHELTVVFGKYRDTAYHFDIESETQALLSEEFPTVADGSVGITDLDFRTRRRMLARAFQQVLAHLDHLPLEVEQVALAKMIEGSLLEIVKMIKMMTEKREYVQFLMKGSNFMGLINELNLHSGADIRVQTEKLKEFVQQIYREIKPAIREASDMFDRFMGDFEGVAIPEFDTIFSMLAYTKLNVQHLKSLPAKEFVKDVVSELAWHLDRLAKQSYTEVTEVLHDLRDMLEEMTTKFHISPSRLEQIAATTGLMENMATSQAVDIFSAVTRTLFGEMRTLLANLRDLLDHGNREPLIITISEFIGYEVSLVVSLSERPMPGPYRPRPVPGPQIIPGVTPALPNHKLLPLIAYPLGIHGDDRVVDVLLRGESGIFTVLEMAVTLVLEDFARQTHTCRKAIAATLFEGETSWIVHTLRGSPDDWALKLFSQLERKETEVPPELYTPGGHEMLRRIGERIAPKIDRFVDQIQDELEMQGLNLKDVPIFVTQYLHGVGNINLEEVKVATVANLLEMTAWKMTESFRMMEGAPCQDAMPAIERTIHAGHTILNRFMNLDLTEELRPEVYSIPDIPERVKDKVLNALNHWKAEIVEINLERLRYVDQNKYDDAALLHGLSRELVVKVVVELAMTFWDYLPSRIQDMAMTVLEGGDVHFKPGGIIAQLFGLGHDGTITVEPYPGGPVKPKLCPMDKSKTIVQELIQKVIHGLIEGVMNWGPEEPEALEFIKDLLLGDLAIPLGLPVPFPDVFIPHCSTCFRPGGSKTPDMHVNVVLNGKPLQASVSVTVGKPTPSILPGIPAEFDPATILKTIRGLITLHKAFVEAGIVPDEDIEEMLLPKPNMPPVEMPMNSGPFQNFWSLPAKNLKRILKNRPPLG